MSRVIQTIRDMPLPIQKRFAKQAFAAVLFVLGTVILCAAFHTVDFLPGIFIALFLAILAADTVRKYKCGEIVCEQMVCIKATRLPGSERMYVIMREIEGKNTGEDAVHKYYLPITKKDIRLITPGMIFNVYYSKTNTHEMVAWEPIDYIGNA